MVLQLLMGQVHAVIAKLLVEDSSPGNNHAFLGGDQTAYQVTQVPNAS